MHTSTNKGGILITILKGIYQIKNDVNNKIYIGSSTNIIKRWGEHITNLNNRSHHSYKLQMDWIKFNITDFSFNVLELVYDDKQLLTREQHHIDIHDIDEIYNIMTYTKYDNNISVPESFINTLNFLDTLEASIVISLKKNLIVFDKVNGKLNSIGNNDYDLSKTWFNKNAKQVDQMKYNIYNYFKNHANAKSNEIAWTTFTQYYQKLKYKGFIKSFIPLNGELLNKINKRNHLCFAANCFPNSFIKNKIETKVNDDIYSLSIMINWIINVSDINKPIHIFLPAKRMENILINWVTQ